MPFIKLTPNKVLNPLYKKFVPQSTEVAEFVDKLEECINTIKSAEERNESEEHIKSSIKRFLENTFYKEYEINTKDRVDLAIYLGKETTTDIGVILEIKRPSNTTEFISEINLNKKALQELVLYYLRERVDKKNNNIKHLIITNGLEWFFFKGEDFYTLFYKNKNLIKEYKQFRDGLKDTSKTELFYNEIASTYIAEVENKLPFVYLDFRTKEVKGIEGKEAINIYKLFSKVHLLGKSFGNDSNTLNTAFYNELLHITGLEEVKENSKKVIQRKKVEQRDYSSLLENTIVTLEDKDYLDKVKNIPNNENKSFTVGLELCLVWINRILFLKLLESQLLDYNRNLPEYRFLNSDFINGFDELNDLFFSALAKPIKERHPKYASKFKYIPYLNSSLFEASYMESLTFTISSLKDEEMQVYSSTILQDTNGRKLKGKLNTLQYLFKFLDAYDFSTESGAEMQENKPLINASVLGLIFEKINGYKEGSFYTPSVITMYMCRESIRKAVVQKFAEEREPSIESFEDVKDYCSRYFKKNEVAEFNQLINSLKICDPAVGSGHFLVSALNELIAIKSELQLLTDTEGKTLPCEVQIEKDELYISDAMGDLFQYKKDVPTSLLIQKALFHEKQTLIENCLFGVDINPNSVNICRLRLWIELLKNAYYTPEGELQTLPNIDINIKKGNSLVSRFSLEDSLKSSFKNKEVEYSLDDYKNAVNRYKQTSQKTEKKEIQQIIDTVKNNFRTTLDAKFKEKIALAVGKYTNEEERLKNLSLFEQKITKEEKNKLKHLKKQAEKAEQQKIEILNNALYTHAFEWRFEFPEVLDAEGNYIGFDVIVGNPPYVQLQKMGAEAELLQKMNYQTYARTGDIYALFYELGYNLLKEKGLLIYITSNKWMRAGYGENLRRFFAEKTQPLSLIDFGGIQIFDSATVDTNILLFAKEPNQYPTEACVLKEKELNNLSTYVGRNAQQNSFTTAESWVILNPIEQSIKNKIETLGTPLKNWDIAINYGIKTGYNQAFIIDGAKREELIAQDPKSEEIIRPLLRGRDIKRYTYEFADLYLITTFPSLKIEIEKYPAVKEHLLSFGYDRLKQTGDKKARKKTNNKWFETQDTIAYFEEFDKPKIIYPNMTKFLPFLYDCNKFYHNDKSFMIVGDKIAFLTAFLNSSLFKYSFRDNFPELQGGTRELRKIFFDKISVIKVENTINIQFLEKVNQIQALKKNKENTENIEREIDNMIFDLYQLTEEEKEIIGFIEIE